MTDMHFKSIVDMGDGRLISAFISVPQDQLHKFDVRDCAEYVQIAVAGMFRNVKASDGQRAKEQKEDEQSEAKARLAAAFGRMP